MINKEVRIICQDEAFEGTIAEGIDFLKRKSGSFSEDGPEEYPGQRLEQKVLEIQQNPPKFDEYGRPHPGYTYSQALTLAQIRYPELAKKYMEYLFSEGEKS